MDEELYPESPILIVDDEQNFLKSINFRLRSEGITNVECCQDSRNVMPLLMKKNYSIILLDILMPNISGDKLFHLIVDKYPYIPIIILTAVKEIKDTFKKMKDESFDYLVKTMDTYKIVEKIHQAINYRADFPEIVADSKKMMYIFKKIRNASKASIEVLITGEAGVGKELAARAIHRLSQQKGDIIKVNFSAKDNHLFQDKLFGHNKGVIKDVYIDIDGNIKQAEEGTLFIDEIGDLLKESQDKLLRLVEEKIYYPLGSETPMYTTARIVLATKHDLKAMMENGSFREDLYYRLHEHQIHVPSLRDRKEDIPCLVEYFIKKESKKYGNNIPKATNEAIGVLSDYNYPGNVRELKNIIYRVVSTYHDLPELPPEVFEKEISPIKKKNKKIKLGKGVNKLLELWGKLK